MWNLVICLFMLILCVPVNNFKSCQDVFLSSWDEQVLSREKVTCFDESGISYPSIPILTLHHSEQLRCQSYEVYCSVTWMFIPYIHWHQQSRLFSFWYRLLSSSDKLCKQFGPRNCMTNCWALSWCSVFFQQSDSGSFRLLPW